MDNPAAVQVQQMLAALGYDVDATGQFDAKTSNAIRYFQNNYYPAGSPGVADPGTINAMIQQTNNQHNPTKFWLEQHAPLLIGGVVVLGLGFFLWKRKG